MPPQTEPSPNPNPNPNPNSGAAPGPDAGTNPGTGPSAPLTPPAPAGPNSARKLTKSRDRMLGGVAGGVAEYLGVDPAIVRLLFVLIALLPGPAFVVYIVAWIIMPDADADISPQGPVTT